MFWIVFGRRRAASVETTTHGIIPKMMISVGILSEKILSNSSTVYADQEVFLKIASRSFSNFE